MKILFVMDQFNHQNNGTTISAKRFADILRDHGHKVDVLCIGDTVAGCYGLGEKHIPLFQPLITRQGMLLAKADEDVLYQAIQQADIVHIYMPTPLGLKCRKIAQKLHVPHTSAFHVQPEHITYNIKLSRVRFAAEWIYRYYQDHFYNHIGHVHCPSQFIANELKKRGYRSKLHVISNGVSENFYYCKRKKSPALKGKFCIIMVGRLSPEKRQELLIEAVLQSPFKDQIQLIFAGDGPRKKYLEQLGKVLPNPPMIHFFPQEKLQKLLCMCDLYVHTSEVESESISCVEAICSGLVPVIAQSDWSATSQFALDERSLFDYNDPLQLKERITYWITHTKEREKMEIAYSEHAKKYQIDHCVQALEDMFIEAISDQYLS